MVGDAYPTLFSNVQPCRAGIARQNKSHNSLLDWRFLGFRLKTSINHQPRQLPIFWWAMPTLHFISVQSVLIRGLISLVGWVKRSEPITSFSPQRRKDRK